MNHVELLYPDQVHKGRVRDGRLVAGAHVEQVDPAQMHEGRPQIP